MMNKKNCSILTFYFSHANLKGTLRYTSFKFLCLSVYMIGFYYIFLNNSLENENLEIVNISNVYERNLGETEKESNGSQWKRNLKLKNEDVNKTKHNTSNMKCNEQKVEENKHNSINHDDENNHVENKSNSSTNNINYNDMSKKLTEKELLDVLNSFEECPPTKDLGNIWNHAVHVVKEGLDDIKKDLKESIKNYLDNDFSDTTSCIKKKLVYATIWEENIAKFNRTVEREQEKYTNDFFNLIKDESTLDDIRKFIYSFIEFFKILKEELYQDHQKELFLKIEKVSVGEN
ncbi:Plasmodium exported protein (PHISTa), unknown, putative [Plasmodium gaboni]|uniref:Plasmodium RESA N-terminal domain-containing protein n=1 Tax=Plasmodium gaboni TaxID=647221 RepID=A0ABY0KW01_9APIC|nr:Plasmodium exported protein (PHISTa), unknown, putative [Plasmodium gaboni]